MSDSVYKRNLSDAEISADMHRAFVGGFWEEIGALQFEFLRSRGLEPSMKLLDIGCGALRGGLHFLRYLEIGNYYGIDRNESLLRAGMEVEAARSGLADRLVSSNVHCNAAFQFEAFGARFDMALAQSVFSHIDMNQIRLCLAKLTPAMHPGGTLFASFFERPEAHDPCLPVVHPQAGIETHSARDPYHYAVAELEFLAAELPWSLEYVGEWGHPRGQMMLAFHRTN